MAKLDQLEYRWSNFSNGLLFEDMSYGSVGMREATKTKLRKPKPVKSSPGLLGGGTT